MARRRVGYRVACNVASFELLLEPFRGSQETWDILPIVFLILVIDEKKKMKNTDKTGKKADMLSSFLRGIDIN